MLNRHPTEEKSSIEYQKAILEKIVEDEIGVINFNNPQEQLGKVTEGKNSNETSKALRRLEDMGVLSFKPKRAFLFFDRSAYQINPKKATEVYDSYFKER